MKTVEPARGANPILGDVDWGKFVSVLGDAGYKGSVCAEVEEEFAGRTQALATPVHRLRAGS